jgi:acyl carrier protein
MHRVTFARAQVEDGDGAREERIEDAVRSFIVENFLFGDAGAVPPPEASLLDRGVMDSTGVLELVSFLEERFGLSVADEELVPENLDSIGRITRFVAARSR